ncbi:MAG: hypothetical protein WBE08_04725 [Methyloceanibacter sp.]|jgi:hypothetical protein
MSSFLNAKGAQLVIVDDRKAPGLAATLEVERLGLGGFDVDDLA